MANLTKKFIESYVADLNNKTNVGIKIIANGSEYTIILGKDSLFAGTIKEAYIFLQGLSYGLGVKGIVSESKDKFTSYNYLKNRVEDKKTLLIEAKKIAFDEYYSQGKNKYIVTIEKLTPELLYFTSELKRYTDDGVGIFGSITIPMCTIKLNTSDSIDRLGQKILKAIDIKVIEMAKSNKGIHNESILWLDSDTMWYLGWRNDKMMTKRVDIKVI